MAVKRIEAIADTGQTLYSVIRREADGFFLNDADGSYSAAPADHFLSLAEHATVKGYYSASESRTIWNDGNYTVIAYVQTGGSPATAADIPAAARQMVVRSDEVINDGNLLDSSDAIFDAIAIIDTNVDTILTILGGGAPPEQRTDITEILKRVKAVQDKLQLLVLATEKLQLKVQ